MSHKISGGTWDPHDVNSVAATYESSLQFWDVRAMGKTISAVCSRVRSVDYHPKRHLIGNLYYLYCEDMDCQM
ncbi:hypothetical protein Ahy_A08g037733 isoform A [Arachis hypogaea]|uniref:Uncharacterized protein n=1 Tax=Arachis hypogaea TaxID=3818 RepID=A0A445BRM3_ARAHY|nr:hypothetical protein Ahy_A08g037733 isoform A [Arachis hypogaea]